MTNYISKIKDGETGKIAYIKDEEARRNIVNLDSQLEDIENKKADKATTDSIQQQVNNLVLGSGGDGNNAEIVQARGTYSTLNDRLNANEEALDDKLSITDEKTYIIGNINKISGYRISAQTGQPLSISGFSYVEINVQNGKVMYLPTKNSGANDLGYAFLDSNMTYISGSKTSDKDEVMLNIPKKACYFRYGMGDNRWEELKDKTMRIIFDIPCYNSLNSKVNDMVATIDTIAPKLGVMDNKLPYLLHNQGTLYDLNEKYTDKENPSTITIRGDFMHQSGSSGQPYTAYLTLLKGDTPLYYHIRSAKGAECEFYDNKIDTGKIIYQTNATTKLATIVYNDDTKFVISFETNLINIKFSCYTDNTKATPHLLNIDEDKSAVFYDVYKDVNYEYKYLSRAEKLNSHIIGKNIFVFSDSQSAFIKPLVQDWGANVFPICAGGSRMGYVGGTGLGGETGNPNDLWLCNPERTELFNTYFKANNIKIDYILNFSGGNGTFENVGTADELKFVLDNKKWFGDTSETDPFASLSEKDKARFTSPLCYIASFIKLTELFPSSISVVCGLYNYVGGGTGRFSNNKWANESDLVTELYKKDRGSHTKTQVLKQISDMIGAIYIDAGKTGYTILNSPYYSDSVHGNFQISTNLAYLIGTTLGFVDRIENEYPTK